MPFTLEAVPKWRDVLDVNVIGALICSAACRPSMAARGGGSIVNMSSIAAYSGSGAYGVSKLALNSLTVSLAGDFASDGIRVNGIAPGLVNSEAAVEWWSSESRAGIQEGLIAGQLIKRQGLMGDLADMALFLCSEEASSSPPKQSSSTAASPRSPTDIALRCQRVIARLCWSPATSWRRPRRVRRCRRQEDPAGIVQAIVPAFRPPGRWCRAWRDAPSTGSCSRVTVAGASRVVRSSCSALQRTSTQAHPEGGSTVISYEHDGATARITIRRPEKHNALTGDHMRELVAAISSRGCRRRRQGSRARRRGLDILRGLRHRGSRRLRRRRRRVAPRTASTTSVRSPAGCAASSPPALPSSSRCRVPVSGSVPTSCSWRTSPWRRRTRASGCRKNGSGRPVPRGRTRSSCSTSV